MNLLFLLLLAPVLPEREVAAPPRELSTYIAEDGTIKQYARKYWVNGKLKKRVHERDTEFEQVVPVLPPGIVPPPT